MDANSIQEDKQDKILSVVAAACAFISIIILVLLGHSQGLIVDKIERMGMVTPADRTQYVLSQIIMYMGMALLVIGMLLGYIYFGILSNKNVNDKIRCRKEGRPACDLPQRGPNIFGCFAMFAWVFLFLLLIISACFANHCSHYDPFSPPSIALYNIKLRIVETRFLNIFLKEKIKSMPVSEAPRLLARDSILLVKAAAVASYENGIFQIDYKPGHFPELQDHWDEFFYNKAERALPALPQKEPKGFIFITSEANITGEDVALDSGAVPEYRTTMNFYAVDLQTKTLVGTASCLGPHARTSEKRPGVHYYSSVQGDWPSWDQQLKAIESLLEPLQKSAPGAHP